MAFHVSKVVGLAACSALAAVWLSMAGPAAAAGGTGPQPQTLATQPSSDPEYVGEETCLTCHEEKKQSLQGTPHARARDPRSPAAAQSCETCHGPGKAHVDGGGDKTKIKTFTTLAPRAVSETCTTCHNRQEHANWQGSPHDTRNLSCVTCHSVHSPKSERAQLKKASQIETCAGCHQAQAMKIKRSVHMPVREGKMECASCHNPHGSTNVKQLRVGNWVNESCVSCHTEKRGPFLWEHAAGRESCVSCHDPHGSTNDRLLVAKLPMLCQRCHIGTRHPSTIYDNKAFTTATSIRVAGRGCVSCHSNIHGSNHPSGNTFLR